jgi:hypothetical protein
MQLCSSRWVMHEVVSWTVVRVCKMLWETLRKTKYDQKRTSKEERSLGNNKDPQAPKCAHPVGHNKLLRE